jgi:hypothetical protein
MASERAYLNGCFDDCSVVRQRTLEFVCDTGSESSDRGQLLNNEKRRRDYMHSRRCLKQWAKIGCVGVRKQHFVIIPIRNTLKLSTWTQRTLAVRNDTESPGSKYFVVVCRQLIRFSAPPQERACRLTHRERFSSLSRSSLAWWTQLEEVEGFSPCRRC